MLFDGWSGKNYAKLASNSGEMKKMVKSLVQTAKKYKFDGYVIEVWSQIASVLIFDALVDFIGFIGTSINY